MDITKQVRKDLKVLIDSNLKDWQEYLEPSCGDEDCENHSTQLTIGLSDKGDEWTYQTGDNSFTGSAYLSPHWVVTYFGNDTTADELLDDILEDIEQIEVIS